MPASFIEPHTASTLTYWVFAERRGERPGGGNSFVSEGDLVRFLRQKGLTEVQVQYVRSVVVPLRREIDAQHLDADDVYARLYLMNVDPPVRTRRGRWFLLLILLAVVVWLIWRSLI